MLVDTSTPVLVVERRRALSSLIEDMLRKLNFENIECASDASSGLEMLQRTGPKIVIADLHLEAMSGLEMLRVTRLDQRLRRCPFLITAETLTPSEARALKNAGVDAFLLKPFRPDVLTPKLQAAFERNVRFRSAPQVGRSKRTSTSLGRRLLYQRSN
jgi:two-component system, chemotaxis family, chemotaxis protein CheY